MSSSMGLLPMVSLSNDKSTSQERIDSDRYKAIRRTDSMPTLPSASRSRDVFKTEKSNGSSNALSEYLLFFLLLLLLFSRSVIFNTASSSYVSCYSF